MREVFKEDVSKNRCVFGTHLSAAMRHARKHTFQTTSVERGTEIKTQCVCGDMCCNVMWPDVLIFR